MRILISLSVALFTWTMAKGQNREAYAVYSFSPTVHFVTVDTGYNSQATVVEYDRHLVVIELPFSNHGADKTDSLQEQTAKAQAFIQFLATRFPGKPIRYVLSSHWHLHSLSAISPFLSAGAKLITTQSNWQYSLQHGFGSSVPASVKPGSVMYITKDSLLFGRTSFPIQVLYMDSSYRNKPTHDFLTFYFPSIQALHTSCMGALQEVDVHSGRSYVYSDRLIDMQRLIVSRQIQLKNIIRLGRVEKPTGGYLPPVFSYAYMQAYMQNGRSNHDAVEGLAALTDEMILLALDSLVQSAIRNELPARVIKQAVHLCLDKKAYKNAIALAQLLNIYQPGAPDCVDVLGEAYFMAGKNEMAQHYATVLQKGTDQSFKGALERWRRKAVQLSH